MENTSKRLCPPHNNGRFVVTDTTCHNHKSSLHQCLHNAHCRALGCIHALRGKEVHENMPIHGPRYPIEKALDYLDKHLPRWIQTRYDAKIPQTFMTIMYTVIEKLKQKL